LRDWEQLVYLINKNCSPKGPYVLQIILICISNQDEVEEENMIIYEQEQIINDPMYDQISYHCCLSNDLKLKLEHIATRFVVEMMCAIGKQITDNIICQTKVIPLAVLRVDVSDWS
jgi:hypothetical protein